MKKKTKVIEVNEFGTKRKDNRLCLVCKKYISTKNWKKHLLTHDGKKTGLKSKSWGKVKKPKFNELPSIGGVSWGEKALIDSKHTVTPPSQASKYNLMKESKLSKRNQDTVKHIDAVIKDIKEYFGKPCKSYCHTCIRCQMAMVESILTEWKYLIKL